MEIVNGLIYYVIFILYMYMYNFISEISYVADSCMAECCDIPLYFIEKNGFYGNIRYYYAHSYLLLLKILGVKIYINKKILKDRMLWISNHRSKLDGLIIQSVLCASKNDTIAVVKNSIRKIPIFGSFGEHVDAIYLNRSNTQSDRNILSSSAKKSIEKEKSILIFPEGTTISPKSKKISDNYAMKKNINATNLTLIPRNTGFDILKTEGKFNKVGNITIRYECPSIIGINEHSYLHLFKIFPKNVYLDVEYLDINDCNLSDLFLEKDKNMAKPIIVTDYPYQHMYSVSCLFFNLILLIIFYLLCFTVPFFCCMTVIISLYSIIKIWIK